MTTKDLIYAEIERLDEAQLDELYVVIKQFTQKQAIADQALFERVDRLMDRMAVQNAAYSDEEIAADIEAARKDHAA
jgi:hypothetical protein